MAEETLPLEVSYIENTSLYTVIDLTEVTVPFYVEIIDLAHDSSLIEIEDLPVFSALNFIEESKVFNITLDSSGKDGKDGLPGKDGIGKPGKDGSSITFESLTPEQIAILLLPATNAASDLYATITQVLNLLNSMPTSLAWFYLDSKGNLVTDYNLYSNKEISAFGIGDTTGGGSSGGAIILDDLTDVIITDPINNQHLVFDTTVGGGKWVNKTSLEFVTLNTALTITGKKTFTDGISVLGGDQRKLEFVNNSTSSSLNFNATNAKVAASLSVDNDIKTTFKLINNTLGSLEAKTRDSSISLIINNPITGAEDIKFLSNNNFTYLHMPYNGRIVIGGWGDYEQGYNLVSRIKPVLFEAGTHSPVFNLTNGWEFKAVKNGINDELQILYNNVKKGVFNDNGFYSTGELSAYNEGIGSGGSGGATNLDSLTDVEITSPQQDQILQFIGGLWKNVSLAGLGGEYVLESVFNTHITNTSIHHTHGNKPILDNVTQTHLDILAKFAIDGSKLKILGSAYATQELSAYGMGAEGGTGGAINLDALTDVTITDATENLILQFKDGLWKNITTINLDTQYVKLNDFSNHTSNSSIHITSSERANWNTAFGWGNHEGLYYTKPLTNDLLADKLDVSIFDSFFEYDAVNDAIKAKYKFYSIGEISAYGAGSGSGSGASGSLGELVNVGIWADEIPTSDRVMVRLSGSTHWSSKLISEIAGLDTVALGNYLTTNLYATQSYVTSKVAELVGTVPETLDTLNELASALGNDPNFATSMSTLIGTKWTQDNSKIGNWDSAYSHISDSVKHITGTERTNWNTAFTNNHTHSNKLIIDNLTQDNLDVLARLSVVDGNLKVDTNFWSTGEVSAYGVGAGSGGGSGLIKNVYGYSGLGGTYNDVTLTDTFNAYTINKINTDLGARINSLEAGSALTFTTTGSGNAVTSVTKSGTSVTVTKGLTFSIDGHTHTFASLTAKPTTLSGYGITDAATGTGGYAYNIYVEDTRGVTTTPDFIDKGVRFDFKSNAVDGLSDGGSYYGQMTFRPYGLSSDWSGGKSHQLGFTDNDNIWHRSGATSWGSWNKIYHSGNFTNLNQLTTRNFSDLQNKPTTLSEYGITDAYTKTQTDGFLALKLDKATFNDLFEKVNVGTDLAPIYAIKAKYDFYSIGEVSAFGAGSSSNTNGGLIQTVYGYDGLSNTYDNSILTNTFNAYTINKINADLGARITSLEAGSALNFTTTGGGNVVTSVTKSGTSVTVTKGLTALTAITKAQVEGALTGDITTHTHSQYLTGNQTITVSGDATGSGTTSIALTLANSGVVAGTYNNSATQVRPFTVDSKGRITNIGNAVTITPAWDSITGKPTTMPASDVSAWAKLATKPTYNASEIGGLGTSYRWLTDTYISTWNAKEPAITKLAAFNKNFGITSGTVAEGDHVHTFASLTNKPTTLAGYGIVDGMYKNTSRVSNTDLNSLKTQGFYLLGDTLTNKNISSDFSNLLVILSSTDRFALLNFGMLDSEIYYRNGKGETTQWNPWRKLFHDGNFSKTQNLLINGSGELTSNYNFTNFEYSKDESYFSRGCFKYTNGAGITVTNDEYMTIIPELRYKFEWYSKSYANRGKYYTFIDCYDVDNNRIYAKNHMYKANTLTWLSEPLVNGADYISVYSTANWDNDGTAGVDTYLRSIIFWNYVDSTGYKYAPLTYSRNWYGDMWDPGSINTSSNRIYLKTPWAGGSIPALTWLSNGRDGSTFKYVGNIGNAFPTSWTNYKGIMNGVDFSGTNADGKFAPGTVKVKVGAIMDYLNLSDTAYFANLSFEVDTSIQATIDNLVGKDLKVANITIDSETPELNLVANADLISKIQFFDDSTKLLGGISASTDNGIDINSANGNSTNIVLRTNSSQKLLVHSTGVNITGNLLATGEITAYQTSDIRLKENIIPIENATEIINKLNPVTYNWNDKAKELNSNKTDKTDIGLIAQELQEVLPNVVGEMYNGEYLGIDYVKVIPYLISAIKELSEEVRLLKMIKDEKTN